MLDVLTIGSATRDIFLKSGSFQLLSSVHTPMSLECVPFGSKIEVEDVLASIGGGAVNAAITLARQGFSVAALARFGADADSDEIKRSLVREGVNISRCIIDRVTKTASSYILLHSSGERSILVHRGASNNWSLNDINEKNLQARWIYISSVSGHFDVLRKIIKIAKKQGSKIFLNPGGKELKSPALLIPLLQHIDILLMNKEEGAELTGIPVSYEQKIFKRLDELEPGILILTDGRLGAAVSDGKRVYRVGRFLEKRLVDRTGTGDAFGSGFLSGFLRRIGSQKKVQEAKAEDIVYAMRLGSANATSKVEGIGATHGLLTKEDFERNLRWQSLSVHIKEL